MAHVRLAVAMRESAASVSASNWRMSCSRKFHAYP
jgi:hypothetical protein